MYTWIKFIYCFNSIIPTLRPSRLLLATHITWKKEIPHSTKLQNSWLSRNVPNSHFNQLLPTSFWERWKRGMTHETLEPDVVRFRKSHGSKVSVSMSCFCPRGPRYETSVLFAATGGQRLSQEDKTTGTTVSCRYFQPRLRW